MAERSFHLGETVEPATHERAGETIEIDGDDLTTHGVIVGMTGSGKTGLGVVLLEEALLDDVPALIIDPKGDLGNLMLTFPDLAPADFEPWAGDGTTGADAAKLWTEGLAGWGLDGERIAALKAAADFTIYTPGSTAGVPLNVVGSLEAPATDDPEVRQEEIQGYVSGLLGLVGVDADPLSSPEHILPAAKIHTKTYFKTFATDL
ncbi:MAG: helicase HerA domain-containing protein, partial [Acidimicrobiales bacterium]